MVLKFFKRRIVFVSVVFAGCLIFQSNRHRNDFFLCFDVKQWIKIRFWLKKYTTAQNYRHCMRYQQFWSFSVVLLIFFVFCVLLTNTPWYFMKLSTFFVSLLLAYRTWTTNKSETTFLWYFFFVVFDILTAHRCTY